MTKIELAIFGKSGYKGKKNANKAAVKSKKKPAVITSSQLKKYQYECLSEEEHQIEFIKWLNEQGLYFETGLEGIFLPNPHPKGSHAFTIQAASNRKVLAKMRATGMKKGVSDIKVYLTNICLHIELKRCDGGKISPEQKNTHNIINNTSYCKHMFCNGYKAAKEFVLSSI